MEILTSALLVTTLIVVFLGLGTWVFAGLLAVALCSFVLVADFPLDRAGAIAQSVIWRSSSAWELAAIPLFIWMGEIIFRTDLSGRLFRGLTPLVQWLPGRLLHTNVAGCTLFAAVSGSTAATTAAVGRITLPELLGRKYHENLAIGSLAGAGSLGMLIPPSIVMIIYGVLAEVSIARLFAAGILPGLLVGVLYATYIIVRCVLDRDAAPEPGQQIGLRIIIGAIGNLLPVFILIGLVLGGIYSGLATPSEAAAVGVSGAIIISLVVRKLSWIILWESAIAAVRLSCMVCAILVAAALLSSSIGFLHLPSGLAQLIGNMDLSAYQLLLMVALFYLILGLFLDGISIIVMSLPLTLPLITMAGFDPIWFGVFLVLMVELAMITPPVGFNLFVIQGITGRSLSQVAYAAFPFFILMCIAVFLISVFPEIALYLPGILPTN